MELKEELKSLQQIAGKMVDEKYCRFCGKTKVRLTIKFTGMPDEYSYWCYCSSENNVYKRINEIHELLEKQTIEKGKVKQ